MKLSIIIPVYKAERWVGRCLNSVFNQKADEREYEVICVIDGSPDNSTQVVREYQKEHSNIVLIEQENKGVSAARNHGLKEAKGEYITFMDSDDEFFGGSLLVLIESLNTCTEDVIEFRAFGDYEEWFPWHQLFKNDDVVSSQQIVGRGGGRGAVWGACYKRRLLVSNQIFFPEGISNGEDSYFFILCLYFAENVRFKDLKLYHVIEEVDSLSRTFDRKKVDGIINSFKILEDCIFKLPQKSDRLYYFQYIRYRMLSSLVARMHCTKGVGYLYLMKKGVNKLTHFEIDDNIVYMRHQMLIMQRSFTLFYLLSWLKSHFNK